MHRIDGAGHVDHLFVAEDPATLRPPTEITPEIMNAFQEELATFIEWAGIALAKGDNTQLRQALVAKFAGLDVAVTKAGVQGQTYTGFTTGGATGAFTLTPVPAITAYSAGQRFRMKFHAAGNGADKLNVCALGDKNLKQYDSDGNKAAPVIAVGQLADVEFDGVDMVLLDPLPPSAHGKLLRITRYTTAGSGTWVKQADTNSILVRAVAGGGGGGGGTSGSNQAGNGGYSGCYGEKLIAAPAANYAYTVGAAGTGGSVGAAGSVGGQTSFGAMTLNGGPGGQPALGGLVALPTSSGWDFTCAAAGSAGHADSTSNVHAAPGAGGASPFAGGGSGSGTTTIPGSYGSGGGGGPRTSGTGYAGSNGGAGYIEVWEFA